VPSKRAIAISGIKTLPNAAISFFPAADECASFADEFEINAFGHCTDSCRFRHQLSAQQAGSKVIAQQIFIRIIDELNRFKSRKRISKRL
jgi:hypothetical protein